MLQLFANGVAAGAAYGLVAASFALIYSVGRFFHFAHASILVAGAYAAYILFGTLGLPVGLSVLGVFAVCAILGLSLHMLVYEPIRRHGGSGLVLFITSLGVYLVGENLIAMGFGDDTKSFRHGPPSAGLTLLGSVRLTGVQIVTVLVCLGLMVGLFAVVRSSRLGLHLRAVADDRELAEVRGISSDGIVRAAFLVGSGLVGVAGMLLAWDTDARPTMGFQPLLMGVTGMLIGGVGSVGGAAVGGLLLGILRHMSLLLLPSVWQDTISFTLLLLFLVVRTKGLAGSRIERVEL